MLGLRVAELLQPNQGESVIAPVASRFDRSQYTEPVFQVHRCTMRPNLRSRRGLYLLADAFDVTLLLLMSNHRVVLR